MPSTATLHRAAVLADPVALDTAVNQWVRALLRRRADTGGLVAVAVDGKEVRGAKHGGGTRTFLMAAFEHRTGVVIGQESVGEKTNEIPHLPLLLDRIGPLQGILITADALHTLPQQAEAITGRGGQYLFTVKANQPRLRDRISAAPWGQQPVQYRQTEKGHGRVSVWEAAVLPAPSRIGFPGARQLMKLTRGRDTQHGETGEIVYAITSLPPEQADATQLARHLRGHWGIENRLHWVRDVAYDEDRSQIRTGSAAHVMATIRNLAISIHRLIGHDNLTAALRSYARRPELAINLTGL